MAGMARFTPIGRHRFRHRIPFGKTLAFVRQISMLPPETAGLAVLKDQNRESHRQFAS
jgi:hypothetical protein